MQSLKEVLLLPLSKWLERVDIVLRIISIAIWVRRKPKDIARLHQWIHLIHFEKPKTERFSFWLISDTSIAKSELLHAHELCDIMNILGHLRHCYFNRFVKVLFILHYVLRWCRSIHHFRSMADIYKLILNMLRFKIWSCRWAFWLFCIL